MARVKHKVAIVTGAARGLGFAIANRLAMEGAAVVITDVLDEVGTAAAEKITAAGGCCSYMHQDVTDEAAWPALVDAVMAHYGGLHILVNNAGIVIPESVETETLDSWRKTQSVNLDAVFMGTKQAVIAMRESGGSVINISSIEGLVGNPRIAAYNASKGGVKLLTKSAALYCAEQGYRVRVNSVHPGYILTDMVRDGLNSIGPEAWDEARAAIPCGELGEADDVAWGVLYLASDEAKYVTGSELVIDGGYTAR
jgi:3(or 17)beta-hydroxysteroid dehydrogenase